MTAARARVPRLGPGAVYLRALDPLFRAHPDLIRVAEIEPSTMWVRATAPDARPRGSALELRDLSGLPQSKLLHGVGYPVGGLICDQDLHVGEFCRWAEALEAPWVSEHLSVLEVSGAQGPAACGFLMPPLQTEAGVDLAVANIVRRRDRLGRPFAFETGVSYFAPRADEMADGAFFAAVAQGADCGVLLDLANLTVNDRNGRDAVEQVLACLPLDQVWELHLAGSEFAQGYWLDAHCGAIGPELAALAADVVADLPHLGAIIFEVAADRLPGFGETAFLRQMEIVAGLWDAAGSGRSAVVSRLAPAPRRRSPASVTPADWEALIATRLLPPALRPADARNDIADPHAFALYAALIAAFRRGAIADLLENTVRLLLADLGLARIDALFDAHFATTPPSLYPSDDALAFAAFLETAALELPGLDDIAAFEAGVIRAASDDRPVQVRLRRPLDALLTAIASGAPIDLPEGAAYGVEIVGPEGLRLLALEPEPAS